MWLRTSCELNFVIHQPTPFVFMLRPRSGVQQWVAREEYAITPHYQASEFTDIYGNLCQRLIADPGNLTVRTSADIMTSAQLDVAPGAPFTLIQYLPEQVLIYLLPSRYCESDRFHEMTMPVVDGQLAGYDQVAAIVDWVRRNISYSPSQDNWPITAVEVNQNGQGVCRDLAHIAIAMCRSISIPARLVVGYLHQLQPMDLHAWFEAYVGGRWYSFDPTQAQLKGGYIAVGFGRDAADVAIYNQFGPETFAHSQKITVELLNNNDL
ncbi:transglutaminase domain-containing protein [Dasania marina]|uniref:transglutaminase domain-containing protein n=1 Tax=Dasania marina TaxID=471499 RepID=UPI00036D2F0E|nr:transglutaminase family protein [Dasania marina]